MLIWSDLLSCRWRKYTKFLFRIEPFQVGTCWTHTCTGSHTHGDRCHIHRSGGQPFTAPGEHGCTVPCSRAPRLRQGGLSPIQLSVHQSFEQWEWESNRPITCIITHSYHWVTAAWKRKTFKVRVFNTKINTKSTAKSKEAIAVLAKSLRAMDWVCLFLFSWIWSVCLKPCVSRVRWAL